jgi:hypothetical protein
VSGYALDERIRYRATLTFLLDESRDFGDVPPRRSPILQARHSGALWRLPELVEVLVRIAAHVVGRESSTLSLSGVERGTQRSPLGFLNGVPHSILRSSEGSSRDLGLNPLRGIWGELDLHKTFLD